MSLKFIAFISFLVFGLYLLFSGSLIIGLVFVCAAILIPAA